MTSAIKVPAIRVVQPIGEFYSAVISADDLIEVSYSDMRRIEKDLDRYVGIQRKLDPGRVEEIGKFVISRDATFPSSIVLAVPGECARFDPATGTLTLTGGELEDGSIVELKDVAKILDGQHRVEGLKAPGRKRFDVPVSIFVDADIADQAYVFATVNLAQTKVNKSLVYDLLDYAAARSPQKTAHEIAVALDKLEGGPFHEMIKRLGTATPGRTQGSETLAQATFVGSLLPFISSRPEEDRYALAKGRKVKADDSSYQKTPWRFLWVDERDTEIAQILVNYFMAVSLKWEAAWKTREAGQILPRTNGFRALMRLLKLIYLKERPRPDHDFPVISQKKFSEYLGRSKLKDSDFNKDDFVPGTGGETALFKRMALELGLRGGGAEEL
ncbi:DGQHR domain-containing protein [Stenotrophomonas rhizophila]|uniref:DGQHR domain-containing protein n=1 Tax=Stenotrophomonas rhizophila TaxID=216778 RepID=UPI000F4C7BD1|nr:DGQHR domain-containing protein [Stenotrophomonas rhizophila]ROP77160.1 DGQHR domain-containing protein [Stenotrophomonas rhizophila]